MKDRLYDLKKDPEQLKNLSGSPEETVWKDKLTNALKQVQAPHGRDFSDWDYKQKQDGIAACPDFSCRVLLLLVEME